MKTAFDPLQKLTTQESIRFVGTIGGVSTNVPEHFSSLLQLFIGREVRTASELVERIIADTKCTQKVAAVSVEEASALGLIASIPGPTLTHKKYLLDDQGRVVNAMRKHPGWSNPARRRLVFLRPMFEANGDYLLQAMSVLDGGTEPELVVDAFRTLVQKMALAKVAELPANQSGSKWDTFRQSVVSRQRSIFGERSAIGDGNLTLEALQKQKRLASEAALNALRKKAPPAATESGQGGAGGTRTLEHHFSRCRAWLDSLGLLEHRSGRPFRLNESGQTLLNYFRSRLRRGSLNIPPSLATLSDCFRMDAEEAADVWGAVIDDLFWEGAILALDGGGSYTPTRAELKTRFDAAFNLVRVTGITEAMLTPLRQTLFFGFLWDGKPIRDLTPVISGDESIPAEYPNEYGFGRNRQGRLAYLFRKS
ncbi:hypothetical protein DBR12_11720 [Acidovorax sp. HMWF029]|uniref:hypothetical protein n=1 Tax=Acidovorax sp. HMWF029 TaxID=2056863 RepID=UPI000D391206|nr:hypothetical protein [Acidovorax sp. HMWF029]PTT19664.1 hypothetical protein DBR12_11720 [Acidovorax sp. HMWF029]